MSKLKPKSDQQQNTEEKSRSGLTLIREVFIVILGVLVALAADDWQENSERNERDQQVLLMLKSELKTNLDHIRNSGNYHPLMLEEIEESIKILKEENRFILPENWRDKAEVPTINSAFQVALVSGTLSRIEPELALTLSSLYDQLTTFDDTRNQIDLSTIQTSFDDGVRYLTLKREALRIEVNYIKKMAPMYQKAIDQIILD